MRESFSTLRPPDSLLRAYPPDRKGLFDFIRPQVTDRMLDVIARCDYGQGVKEHYRELVRIRSGIDFDPPLGWCPNEVLSLFRWSRFENEQHLRRPHEFHLARAFCCCALLLTSNNDADPTPFSSDTLAPLVESCLELGPSCHDRLLPFLTYTLTVMEPWDEDFLFHAFALAAVLGLIKHPLYPEALDWLIQAQNDILPWHKRDGQPRTFLEIGFHSISAPIWRKLVRRLIDETAPHGRHDEILAEIARY
jgi:hypothetical protein